MAKATTAPKARAPQGAKRVAQAFFDELATIAEDKQADVAKAAQAMVRETLVTRREKAKAAKLKARASKPAPTPARRAAKATGKARAATSGRKPARPRRNGSSRPASGEAQNAAENAGET